MKMALKSSDPKENDKILKKKNISSFWGVLGGLETPKNFEKNFEKKFIIFFGL